MHQLKQHGKNGFPWKQALLSLLGRLICSLTFHYPLREYNCNDDMYWHLEINKKQCKSMHLPCKFVLFIVAGSSMEETLDLRNCVELATSVSDKHLDLLRPSARSYSIFRGIDRLWHWWYVNISEIQKWFYFLSKFSSIIFLHTLFKVESKDWYAYGFKGFRSSFFLYLFPFSRGCTGGILSSRLYFSTCNCSMSNRLGSYLSDWFSCSIFLFNCSIMKNCLSFYNWRQHHHCTLSFQWTICAFVVFN